MKNLILLFGILFFVSCSKEDVDNRETTHYVFNARQCKYMWASNLKSEIVKYETLEYKSISELKDNEAIGIDKYVMRILTSNVNNINSHEEYLASYDEPDKEIERKLDVCFNFTRANLMNVEYRTTPVKNMVITSDVELNGFKAGESINELFKISGYGDCLSFIVTADKNLVTGKDKLYDISIDQFLYYHPMAPVEIDLTFRDDVDITEEMPMTFKIELTTDEGNVIGAQTTPITIKPKSKL